MITKAELRKAIAGKCKDCIYDNSEPGTWRQQVTACTIKDCPLWAVRPKATVRIKEVKQDD